MSYGKRIQYYEDIKKTLKSLEQSSKLDEYSNEHPDRYQARQSSNKSYSKHTYTTFDFSRSCDHSYYVPCIDFITCEVNYVSTLMNI